jgi:hypothetical protein
MKNQLSWLLVLCMTSACTSTIMAQEVSAGVDGVDASIQSRVQDPDLLTTQPNLTSQSSISSSGASDSWWIGQVTTTGKGPSDSPRQQQTMPQVSATWTSNPFMISAYSTATNATASASGTDGQTQKSKPLKSTFADRIKKYVSTSTNDEQAGSVFGTSRTDDSDTTASILNAPKASVFDPQRLRRMMRTTRAARNTRSRVANPFAPNVPEASGPAWSNASSAEGLRQQSHESSYLLRYGFNAQREERAHHRRRAHKQVSHDRG